MCRFVQEHVLYSNWNFRFECHQHEDLLGAAPVSRYNKSDMLTFTDLWLPKKHAKQTREWNDHNKPKNLKKAISPTEKWKQNREKLL